MPARPVPTSHEHEGGWERGGAREHQGWKNQIEERNGKREGDMDEQMEREGWGAS
jgi:hypothetical protein